MSSTLVWAWSALGYRVIAFDDGGSRCFHWSELSFPAPKAKTDRGISRTRWTTREFKTGRPVIYDKNNSNRPVTIIG